MPPFEPCQCLYGEGLGGFGNGPSSIGLGPSAHFYGNQLKSGMMLPREQFEELTDEQLHLEKWMLALRLSEGFPEEWLNTPLQKSRSKLFQEQGYIEKRPEKEPCLRLPPPLPGGCTFRIDYCGAVLGETDLEFFDRDFVELVVPTRALLSGVIQLAVCRSKEFGFMICNLG